MYRVPAFASAVTNFLGTASAGCHMFQVLVNVRTEALDQERLERISLGIKSLRVILCTRVQILYVHVQHDARGDLPSS